MMLSQVEEIVLFQKIFAKVETVVIDRSFSALTCAKKFKPLVEVLEKSGVLRELKYRNSGQWL